ncbi:MAG: hypothetical protein Q8O72_14805 [Bacteroidales bacterium]|jgi:hypothetical protein|nr:hypothetical protein [Bacteroidales bacterium]
MPISSQIKGLQSIKSMQNVNKSGIPNKEDSDFIKLYIYEKERSRLKGEEIKILQRLEFIQTRLKEIQEFTNEKLTPRITPEEDKMKKKPQNEAGDKKWKTMSIDY